MRSTFLLSPEAAVSGRRLDSGDEGETGNCILGTLLPCSSPKEEEREDHRDSGGKSGDDRGGAKPVMQSMTKTRCPRRCAVELLRERDTGTFLPSMSSKVASGRFRRSTRWSVVYA